MPTYKVRYKGEVHEIDWAGPNKPNKDELRLAISNKILEKEAPPKIDNSFKQTLPNIPAPRLKNQFGQDADEYGLPRMYGDETEKFLTTPLLPDVKSEPDTWLGGFGKGLYKEWIQPFSTPRSIAQEVLTGGSAKLAKRFPSSTANPRLLPDLPEPVATPLELPNTPKNFADEPIPRWDNTYGVTPRPTDDPLLAHVPMRLQPTSPTQQYFDNILPSTIRERVKRPADIVDEFVPESTSQLPPPPRNEIMGSTLGRVDAAANEMSNTGRLPDLPTSPSGRPLALNEEAGLKPYEAPSAWSNAMNLTKSIKTTLDLSAPLRQGLSRIHTKEYWGAWKPMIKSLMSEKGYYEVLSDIAQNPNLSKARDAGLSIFEREEQLASNLAERIPALSRLWKKSDKVSGFSKLSKRSNAAYDAFIKKLRMDTFDNLLQDAEKAGLKTDVRFNRQLAEVINTATGRGTLGKLEKNADLLNNIFFSPKFISSRLQLFNPQYYKKLDPFARKEAIQSTISMLTFGTGIASLAKLAGADVEMDSTSSDYGKIRLGNVRIDPYGGLQQYVTFLSKMKQGQQKSPVSGNILKFGEEFGGSTRLSTIGRFGQSKLNPLLGLGARLAEGKDYTGKPIYSYPTYDAKEGFNPGEVAKAIVPMLIEDTSEMMINEPEMLPTMIPSALGMGVQRFESQSGKRKRRARRKQ